MTIKQDLKKLQRELNKLANQTEKTANSLGKLAFQAEKMAIKVADLEASKPTKSAATKKKPAKISDSDKVLRIIKKFPNGITKEILSNKTGFDGRKLSNILYTAAKSGKIKIIDRGKYVAK